MIKNTPSGNQDLILLNRAMDRVEQGLLTINESAKQLNGFKSLLEIQSRFSEVRHALLIIIYLPLFRVEIEHVE